MKSLIIQFCSNPRQCEVRGFAALNAAPNASAWIVYNFVGLRMRCDTCSIIMSLRYAVGLTSLQICRLRYIS